MLYGDAVIGNVGMPVRGISCELRVSDKIFLLACEWQFYMLYIVMP